MDPQIIIALIAGTSGIIVTKLYEGISEWARGRKDEAQRISRQLDKERRSKTSWVEHAHIVRRMLIDSGTPYTDLPQTPDKEE